MTAKPSAIARSSTRAIRRLTTAAFALDVLVAAIAVVTSIALVVGALDPQGTTIDPMLVVGAIAATLATLVLGALAFATARIRRHAELLEFERTDLREAYDRARLDSLRDGLTGLGNHRAFQEELDVQVATAREEDSPVALLIVDVDDLKKINDRKGHAAQLLGSRNGPKRQPVVESECDDHRVSELVRRWADRLSGDRRLGQR